MKLKSVINYEIGNGIEVYAEKNNKKYHAYLQMPETGDSQHAFLDTNTDEDVLKEIVEEVEKQYKNIELCMLTELGSLDYKRAIFKPSGYRKDFYVFVAENDPDDYQYFMESDYADYYNTVLIEPLENDQFLLEDEDLMEELHNKRKELVEEIESE